MAIDNKHKVLIGLVLFLAALMTYRIINPYRQQTVSKLTYGRTNIIAAVSSVDAERPTKVMSALFAHPPQLDVKVGRDPFRRLPKPSAIQASGLIDNKPPPREVLPLDRMKEQLRRFKVFGSFRQGDRTSLFLQRGKQVLIVSKGDRIDGEFKIESLDGHSVVVSTRDTEPFEFIFEEVQAGADNGAGRSLSSVKGAAFRPTPTSGAPQHIPSQAPPPDVDEEVPSNREADSDPSISPEDIPPDELFSRPLPTPLDEFPGSSELNSRSFTPERKAD
ncbi:MAG: hypothetical protein JJV98_10915 [Desulfosarcina sp.]|nr:hypothetical protein [Desulfobacterales bacterium]